MKLLLFEDDELLAESRPRACEMKGTASTRVREATSLMATEDYALAILDIGLPHGSGLDLLERCQLGRRGLRLGRSMPGHGLGLAILRQLVAYYGGEVALHPAARRGRVVTLTIPRP